MKNSGYVHKVLVVENVKETDSTKKIIGTGSIFIEPKFIHKGEKVAHIEDLVVQEAFKETAAPKLAVALKDVGIQNTCYRIIVDTDSAYENVFKGVGFQIKHEQMVHVITETEREELRKALICNKDNSKCVANQNSQAQNPPNQSQSDASSNQASRPQ